MNKYENDQILVALTVLAESPFDEGLPHRQWLEWWSKALHVGLSEHHMTRPRWIHDPVDFLSFAVKQKYIALTDRVCGFHLTPTGVQKLADLGGTVEPTHVVAEQGVRSSGSSGEPRTYRKGSTYEALRRFFASQNSSDFEMTLEQIEEISGHLPPSASKYSAWWYINAHCVWEREGYKAHPKLKRGVVRFTRR
jgi:hypothetical protein